MNKYFKVNNNNIVTFTDFFEIQLSNATLNNTSYPK